MGFDRLSPNVLILGHDVATQSERRDIKPERVDTSSYGSRIRSINAVKILIIDISALRHPCALEGECIIMTIAKLEQLVIFPPTTSTSKACWSY